MPAKLSGGRAPLLTHFGHLFADVLQQAYRRTCIAAIYRYYRMQRLVRVFHGRHPTSPSTPFPAKRPDNKRPSAENRRIEPANTGYP